MQRPPLPELFLLFLLFSGNSWKVSAEAATLSTPPQGIQTLGVEIHGIHRDYQRYGLDPIKLTERVTQQLQEAGFIVIPAKESRTSPSAALLQININLVRAYFGYPYGITVKLVQKTSLAAPSDGFTPTVTWSRTQTGVLRLPELSRINDYTAAVVAQFIGAVPPSPHEF